MARTTGNDCAGFQQSFSTTHWSIVLVAAQADAPSSRDAWERLARAYWYPLYAYIRRSGRGPEDAQDLAQSFFLSLMERGTLEGVVEGKGRFRSFLLVCLKHFLTDDHRRSQATRRRPKGGWLNFHDVNVEGQYQAELVDDATPDSLFEFQWASAMVDQALEQLEAQYIERGRRELFEHLVAHLVCAPDAVPHAELAARIGMSEGTVKNEMSRLRQRFQLLFRTLVASMVPAQEIDDEIRHVFRTLAR